jgi:hypothetical protein
MTGDKHSIKQVAGLERVTSHVPNSSDFVEHLVRQLFFMLKH